MDGVFMRKFVKGIWTLVLIIGMFCFGLLLADRISLQRNLIRLHVVANSNTQEDQARKLMVRDAVTAYLEDCLAEVDNPVDAYRKIDDHLLQIEEAAINTLSSVGDKSDVRISLGKEAFPVRQYDTFSLPSGIYQSLRVEIGEGEGENWWCVVFPALCIPDSVETFSDVAKDSGINDQLSGALSGKEGYQIRFFLLDCIGKLENIIFGD